MKQDDLFIAKTLIFSDFHGDLDIMAKSFTDKGLMNYNGDLESLIHTIKNFSADNESFCPESLIVNQKEPVRLIILGDCLDRYDYGYHIIRFLSHIAWKNFNIHPVFLLGNHDLLNFMFMTNPFKVYELHNGTGREVYEVTDFINMMGIDKSIKGFFDLHGDEIFDLQKMFYQNSSLEFNFDHYSVSLKYDRDYSFFNRIRTSRKQERWKYINRLVDELNLDSKFKINEDEDEDEDYSREDTVSKASWLFNIYFKKQVNKNWWTIEPDNARKHGTGGYGREIISFNAWQRTIDEDSVETLPLDWRVISMVWRKYYGDWFNSLKYLFHEKNTLYVHGGLSPMSMMDPMVLGAMYDHGKDSFKPRIFKNNKVDLDILIGRCNRMVSQVLKNNLNDFSFQSMAGAEIFDQMGFWRGMSDGFTTFGGPLWCDFEFIHKSFEDIERLPELYKNFCNMTCIKRIVCGHTHFRAFKEP
ncbi:metallophosphoesterase, partial [Desulfobacterales bacterium HSG17]|nr:metallophosphoesterase [Desulfobacterales bacterium HSG17]